MQETFIKFPKIPRLNRAIFITEKIDGTNAQVIVQEDGQVLAGSQNRLITPDADNFGFAAWVQKNYDELRTLGIGRHYGEWWGQGIQRGYGLTEKRFSLFNYERWGDTRPACCHVVPLLYYGLFGYQPHVLDRLRYGGSVAAPGFMKPEGIVIYHTAAQHYFKVTCEKDAEHKGTNA